MIRTALIAAAAVAAFGALPANAEQAQCAASAVRVYFDDGSSALSGDAQQTLAIAQRNCAGGDVHLRVDGASPLSHARAYNVVNALGDGARADIEPRPMSQSVAYDLGPAYVEVRFAPHATPVLTAQN